MKALLLIALFTVTATTTPTTGDRNGGRPVQADRVESVHRLVLLAQRPENPQPVHSADLRMPVPQGFNLVVSRDFLRPYLAEPAPLPSAAKNQKSDRALDAQPTPVGQVPQPTVVAARTAAATRGGGAAYGEVSAPPLSAVQTYAESLVGPVEFACLLPLWEHESHWNPAADNPHSTAFGIAQRLDETSPDYRVQIIRGLSYIAARYGTACHAWTFWRAHAWY